MKHVGRHHVGGQQEQGGTVVLGIADDVLEAEGAEGAMGSEGVIGAEEDKGASIYILLDG